MKLRERKIFQPKFHLSEQENHDRWAVSYADFVTLLLCFFIAMFAISNINLSKYEKVAESLGLAFNHEGNRADNVDVAKNEIEPEEGQAIEADNQMRDLANRLKIDLKDLIDYRLLEINAKDEWIQLSLKSNMLFKSGDAVLLSQAGAVLEPIGLILQQVSNPIQVEGFTDNIPITNPLYPSNWELSAARASSVARFLIGANIPSYRISVAGFADNFPIGDNSTLVGREENRRVNIVISQQNALKRLQSVAYKPANMDTVVQTAPTNTDYQQQLETLWLKNQAEIEQLKKLRQNGTLRFSNHPERQ